MTAINDIIRDKSGPLCGVWHCDGHDLSWQMDMITAGVPMVPTVRLANYYRPDGTVACDSQKVIDRFLTPHVDAFALLQERMLPVFWRCNNIDQSVAWKPRPAIDSPDLMQCPNVIRRKADGTLNITPIPDVLGPDTNWREHGQTWGASLYVRRLNELCGSTPWMCLLANDEVFDGWKRYLTADRTAYAENLGEKSIRMETLAETWPVAGWPYRWAALRSLLHAILFETFEDSVDSVERLRASYGDWGGDELPGNAVIRAGNTHLDWCSPRLYMTVKLADLTNPAWFNLVADKRLENELASSDVMDEYSVSLEPKALFIAAENGIHAPLTVYKRWNLFSWLYWYLRRPGTPLLLRWYEDHDTAPQKLFFGSEEVRERAESLGFDGTTRVEYVEHEWMMAAEHICNVEAILDFWRDGEWLEFAPTTPRIDTYYAGSIQRDKSRALVFAWTPHSTFTPFRVTIPGMGSALIPEAGYWLVERPVVDDLIAKRI